MKPDSVAKRSERVSYESCDSADNSDTSNNDRGATLRDKWRSLIE